jgi:hypothetical protein
MEDVSTEHGGLLEPFSNGSTVLRSPGRGECVAESARQGAAIPVFEALPSTGTTVPPQQAQGASTVSFGVTCTKSTKDLHENDVHGALTHPEEFHPRQSFSCTGLLPRVDAWLRLDDGLLRHDGKYSRT